MGRSETNQDSNETSYVIGGVFALLIVIAFFADRHHKDKGGRRRRTRERRIRTETVKISHRPDTETPVILQELKEVIVCKEGPQGPPGRRGAWIIIDAGHPWDSHKVNGYMGMAFKHGFQEDRALLNNRSNRKCTGTVLCEGFCDNINCHSSDEFRLLPGDVYINQLNSEISQYIVGGHWVVTGALLTPPVIDGNHTFTGRTDIRSLTLLPATYTLQTSTSMLPSSQSVLYMVSEYTIVSTITGITAGTKGQMLYIDIGSESRDSVVRFVISAAFGIGGSGIEIPGQITPDTIGVQSSNGIIQFQYTGSRWKMITSTNFFTYV